MFVKKTGYVIGSQNNLVPYNCYPTKITKVGYVLRQSEKTQILKNIDLTDIRLQGNIYYQVISNAGACEACEEHNGAIYPIVNAKEGVNLPPFHPNCKCSIQEYSSENPNYDPWRGEVLLWLDIMYGDGSLEQKAQKVLDFYSWTKFSVEFIARVLTATEDITHIGKRIEGFFRLLELASEPIVVTPKQLEYFGWHTATQEEADRLTAAFAEYGITTRESVIQFMALAAAESGYGQRCLEMGDDAYWEKNGYDRYTRGAGYLQVTHGYNHEAFLEFIGDNYRGVDTASYIAEHYPLESAIWFWITQGYHDGGINEFVETRLAKDDGISLSYLKTAYYVAGVPSGESFNQNINDAIAGKVTYILTEDELIIRGNHYPFPSRWKDRLEAYEKAQKIW